MDALLKQRVETEARLGRPGRRLQQLENDYRERDSERQKAIQQSDDIRQELERARLQQQELELECTHISAARSNSWAPMLTNW